MMSRIMGKLTAVALLGATLAACASDSGPKEVGGTLVGAGAGALIGNAIGAAAGNRAAGTIAGAAIGGMLGNRVGAAMDDEDKRRAYAAQMQALEGGPSGAPVAWRNPDSGRYGSVVPGPAYDQNGMNCRQFTHTIYIEGNRKPRAAPPAATRMAPGSRCDRCGRDFLTVH